MKKLCITLIGIFALTAIAVSQENKIPLIGSKAPSFTLQSTAGLINFPEAFGNNWKILFSHPQDFTPVCTSELLELAFAQKDFDEMGVKIAVISVDNIKVHNDWKLHLEDLDYKQRGKQTINFPILEDLNAKVSRKYGMLHEPVSTNRDIRGVFVIDGQNVIRSVSFYPMEIGRNIDEIKRIVLALKTTDEHKVLTPANWAYGDDLLMPYFPFSASQLTVNPEIKNDFYSVGDRLWFKKTQKNEP